MKLFVHFYRRLSPLQRSLMGAIFGFALYGSWAVFVNLMHGEESAVRAGLTQGIYSFVLTFFMTLLIESVFQKARSLFGANAMSVAITVLISCSLVFAGSWYVNFLSGTPEIFNTVILGYVLGGFYAIVYTVALARETA